MRGQYSRWCVTTASSQNSSYEYDDDDGDNNALLWAANEFCHPSVQALLLWLRETAAGIARAHSAKNSAVLVCRSLPLNDHRLVTWIL